MPLDLPPLDPGPNRLRIARIALTANTVTYATFGAAMRHWDFFPTDDGTGRVPVWGFADVVDSRAPRAAVGWRVCGFWPCASHATLTPARATDCSFDDATPHRADLPMVSNRYAAEMVPDTPASGAERALFEPLFLTAFLLAMDLRTAAEGARALTVTGTSSKTALALAAILRHDPLPGVAVEGVTSGANRAFVVGSGLFDRVASYDDLIVLPDRLPRLIVDMVGSAAVNRALHARFGDHLTGNIRVRAANWADRAPARDLPGPRPRFFFAPDALRTARGGMGMAALGARMSSARGAVRAMAQALVTPQVRTGAGGAQTAWRDLVAGQVRPDVGLILES